MPLKALGPLPPYRSIGFNERRNAYDALRNPLSGYLGGVRRSGKWVSNLEHKWRDRFATRHAIACNSATSGLWAACRAIGLKPGDEVWTTPYSMSATAACAYLCGAKVKFIDIEPQYFSINMNNFVGKPKAIIVTNLFGHPAYLLAMRSWCNANGVWMIEDNAQAPLAMEQGKYTGTIGHIGVFSLNIHKHIQCGEGGVVVTDSDDLAGEVWDAINHGECMAGSIGLNLRMTELTAAVACSQIDRADDLVSGRIRLAKHMTEIFSDIPFVLTPLTRAECRHVYYLWAGMVMDGKRDALVREFANLNIPIRAGYSPLLNQMFGEEQICPVARDVDNSIIIFEVCAHDPSLKQLRQMDDLIHVAAERVQ